MAIQLRWIDVLLELERSDCVEIVKQFIHQNPKQINNIGGFFNFYKGKGSLLNWCCIFNRANATKYLISHGADMNKKFKFMKSIIKRMFMSPIYYRKSTIVEKYKKYKGRTPLMIASLINDPLLISIFKMPPKEQDNRQSNNQLEQNSHRSSFQNTERESEISRFLSQLGMDIYIEKFEKYHLTQPDDFLHLVQTDWDNLQIPPFHKKKIIDNLPKLPSVPTLNSKPSPSTSTPNSQPSSPSLTVNSKPTPNFEIPLNNNTPTSRNERRRDPPTARLQPGRRFLSIVPNSQIDMSSILNSLTTYAQTRKLDEVIIQQFKDKVEDFTLEGNHPERALSLALCWLYTLDSWVYKHINEQLRDDSSTMSMLSPFMNALMRSYQWLTKDNDNFSGTVYRRTSMTQNGLDFYKPETIFVWSSFTSTTVDFIPLCDFGDILFVINIPHNLRKYALFLENVSAYPLEREVLLLPNVAFIVKSVNKGPTREYPNTSTIVHLEVSYVCVS